MNYFASTLKPWMLLAPELSLIAVTLGVFFSAIYKKSDSPANLSGPIHFGLVGCVLVFLSLFLIWPVSGSVLYGAFRVDPLAIFFKGIFLGAGFVTLLMTREYS